jgi:hypothetical protein
MDTAFFLRQITNLPPIKFLITSLLPKRIQQSHLHYVGICDYYINALNSFTYALHFLITTPRSIDYLQILELG